jgi:hypothetical protein
MRSLTFTLILFIMAGLSYDIYRHTIRPRPHDQQESQSPIGWGMVWWWPPDISYNQSGEPYPFQGHSMPVVDFPDFEMD